MSVDEFKEKKLLGTLWRKSEPEVKDYACNTKAEEIAKWNIVKMLAKERGDYDEEVEYGIKIIKNILLKRGNAEWIKNSDPLTQLAIKAEEKVKIIDLSKEDK